MRDLEKARALLEQESYTCVICRGEDTVTDRRRGVRPLLELLESGKSFADYSAADKVVGKAAAFLYCLLGIRALYAGVLSEPARDVLASAGIHVEYGSLVPAIRNRTGDGFCPMESAVWELNDPADAPDAIRAALRKLS
jgi:hypothetical protein